MVIVDMGSGNTCQNDIDYAKRMIDALADVDSHKHEVVIKWQLFLQSTVPACEPLEDEVFYDAYTHAEERGYRTTASVFDDVSLRELLTYDVPFVKFAARPWVYHLVEKVPRGTTAVVSVSSMADFFAWRRRENVRVMCCVPQYPAPVGSYEMVFADLALREGVSDHCPNPYLFKEHGPLVYERHFKLPDSTGLDSGAFASTPEEWGRILA